ncbi:peptidoglycan DD-metalloendopeptidase family protein [Nonomuraea sp. CA-141351]|uniref:M23 family metallopeptidase n=1 Tax=Nonomuraea sp. CA-141351 TaxID=3239996 RepID=UPI003D918CDC
MNSRRNPTPTPHLSPSPTRHPSATPVPPNAHGRPHHPAERDTHASTPDNHPRLLRPRATRQEVHPRRTRQPDQRSHPELPVHRRLKPTREALTALTLLFAAAMIFFPALPARASPPTWRWPLDGHPRILRRFTPPPEPWLAGHRGLDLAAPAATPVLAAGPGTVRFAGPVAGRGVITVEHEGGLRTTYLPVKASVRRGQPVTSGSRLGVLEASTGHCQESCLHWGLLRRGTHYLDPLLLLGHAPIRLLPFWPMNQNDFGPVDADTLGQPAAGSESTPPLSQQQSRSPTAPRPLPPGHPTALALTPARPTLTANTAGNAPPPPPHHYLPNPQPPLPHDGLPVPQQPPLTTSNATTPTASRQRQRPAPQTTNLGFLPRSASTPATPAIALGALLGIALLITALRRHRRTRTAQHTQRGGQHRRHRHRRRPRKHRHPPSQ